MLEIKAIAAIDAVPVPVHTYDQSMNLRIGEQTRIQEPDRGAAKVPEEESWGLAWNSRMGYPHSRGRAVPPGVQVSGQAGP